jgi:hypothetical protein
MNEPAKYLRKLISIRKQLMRINKSQINVFIASNAIRATEAWLDGYPNATPAQVVNFIRLHRNQVLFLLPGKGSKSHQGLIEQLTKIMNQYPPQNATSTPKTQQQSVLSEDRRTELRFPL